MPRTRARVPPNALGFQPLCGGHYSTAPGGSANSTFSAPQAFHWQKRMSLPQYYDEYGDLISMACFELQLVQRMCENEYVRLVVEWSFLRAYRKFLHAAGAIKLIA